MSSYEDQLEIERLAQRIADREAKAGEEFKRANAAWSDEFNKFHWPEFLVGSFATPVCLFIMWVIIHSMMRIG